MSKKTTRIPPPATPAPAVLPAVKTASLLVAPVAVAKAGSKEDRVSAHRSFVTFLTARGLRLTGQRNAIFDATINRRHHFTAEELLVDARAIDSSVSRATVYRSLPILVESGLVREVDLGRDFKYYVCTRHQNTFQAQIACPDCEKIVEVDAPFMDWYGKTMAEKHGMELVSQRLQIIARCKDCAGKK
jgi:Fur family ferric uptake transcriptional regulator